MIISLVGARPQFVKLAPLAQAFAELGLSKSLRHDIYHSGQHYDPALSDVFFSQLKIPDPKGNLNVGSGAHGAMTAEILASFERVLLEKRPALVIVYGDTNTTLAGALAAVKLGIPLAHVEAGLRCFDLKMPEEINRRMTDHVSQLLLAPTTESVKNLRRESVPGIISRSGDLMYELLDSLRPQLSDSAWTLKKYNLTSLTSLTTLTTEGYALFTAHRPATVDSRDSLEAMLKLLAALERPVIFPMHPRTAVSLTRHKLKGKLKSLKQVKVCQPLSYQEILTLARSASIVVTDSGGLQKEAVFLGVKCLTMRETTEWTETLKWGNHLIGLSTSKMRQALNSPSPSKKMTWKIKGRRPSELIWTQIREYLDV